MWLALGSDASLVVGCHSEGRNSITPGTHIPLTHSRLPGWIKTGQALSDAVITFAVEITPI
jgi:hypothetical protein